MSTAVIAVAQAMVRAGNLSLVYLLVVLWLASVFGRGPAVLASVLAFFAYDFFFLPPLYQLTVDDPTEWISLGALLTTSLVLGSLTASVRTQAREARESQQRTAMLYGLSQLIAATTEYDALIMALARRVLEVFGPDGVVACTLIRLDERGEPVTRAAVTATGRALLPAVTLEEREQRAQALWVIEHGMTAGGHVIAEDGVSRLGVCYFLPLRSRGGIVGALGIAGTEEMRSLIVDSSRRQGVEDSESADGSGPARAGLLGAFREQIALALDRSALQQQAIHVEALRESDQLKDALLGSVTHDLRTPLAAIQAAASTLLSLDGTRAETDRRELAESISASANRLNRLVGNLLDLSRLEAGVARPVKEWHLIGDVLGTVLARLDLTGQTRGRVISTDIPENLPLTPLDHAQIEQVLTNVLENALKYSPGDAPIEVRARVVEQDGQPAALEVRITDHGVGIPSGELQAIFGKFYRVRQTMLPWMDGKPPAGTGLGLAISDAIVRAHEGQIWAQSPSGEGTTIIFTLPIPADGPRGVLPEAPMGQEAPELARTEAAP